MLNLFSPGLDPVLILMYLLSVVAYFGGAALMLHSTYVTWTTPRPWGARIWSALLALSALVLLVLALTYHFMSFVTKY